MTTQEADVHSVPLEIIQSFLAEHLGHKKATLTNLNTELMQHAGLGGNNLYRVKLTWESGAHSDTANWIVKQWRPGGLISRMMGVTQPVEALAWRDGLFNPQSSQSLLQGVTAPYIGASFDQGQETAWIAMTDISSELTIFQNLASAPQKFDRIRFILDRLAAFHVYWEQTERWSYLSRQKWLLPQTQYLWASADAQAVWLGQQPREGYQPSDQPVADLFKRLTLIFLDWLPQAERQLWETHMVHRQALVDAFVDLPQTLCHGDLSWTNIGLLWEPDRQELLLIDWELMGLGSPALDVARFIHLTLELRGGISEGTDGLADYYFERYLTHGGGQIDPPGWERAYHLAFIFVNLWQLSIWAGGAISQDQNLPTHMVPDLTFVTRRITQTTEAIRKWLG